MSRKSPEARINELDHDACRRVLILISKGVEFDIALKSEARRKEKTVAEAPGQQAVE